MDKQAKGTTVESDVLSAKCSFKTLKAPKSDTVLRDFRPAVTVQFPQLSMEAAISHPRYFPAVRVLFAEAAKSIIQEVERKAATVEAKADYKHDMQAEANRVTLDSLMAAILDGAMDKEDVEGWWNQDASHIRAYYKNAKQYDDARIGQTMQFLRGQLFAVHADRFKGSKVLQDSLVVVLNRMPEHPVRDYLLGKLTAKQQVSEDEGLALIGE